MNKPLIDGLFAAPKVSKYAVAPGTDTPTIAAPTPPSSAPPATSPGASDPSFFLNAINSDPLYAQDKADFSAQGVQDAQSAASNIVRTLVQRGLVPDLSSAASKLGLSSNVLNFLKNNVDFGRASALAKEATDSGVSDEARLARQHNDNVQAAKDRLAARGLAASGASPFLLGREADNYKIQRYDADRQTADYINGAIAAFSQAERERQNQLRQSASSAADRQRQLLGSATPTTATPPSGGTYDETFGMSPDIRDLLARAARLNKNIAV